MEYGIIDDVNEKGLLGHLCGPNGVHNREVPLYILDPFSAFQCCTLPGEVANRTTWSKIIFRAVRWINSKQGLFQDFAREWTKI